MPACQSALVSVTYSACVFLIQALHVSHGVLVSLHVTLPVCPSLCHMESLLFLFRVILIVAIIVLVSFLVSVRIGIGANLLSVVSRFDSDSELMFRCKYYLSKLGFTDLPSLKSSL